MNTNELKIINRPIRSEQTFPRHNWEALKLFEYEKELWEALDQVEKNGEKPIWKALQNNLGEQQIPEQAIELPSHNWDALQKVNQKRNKLSIGATVLSVAGPGLALFNVAGLLLMPLARRPLNLLAKASRIKFLMEALLNEFEGDGVQVFPAMNVEGHNPLDLLIRFPQKLHVILSIRSMGETKISYRADTELLYVRRSNKKGVKKWTPDPLNELSAYQTWLTKNRGLFNMSSKEVRNTRTIKLLVLCQPTQIADRDDHLYSTIDSVKSLVVRKKGTIFVVYKEEVIQFLKGTLKDL